ncbi:MAG: 2-dehydro-3-deoxyphosphooctonate aldolase [Syntrophorhabdaceae bacterium PtaU1.Bin034]|jgi:2-dehydro-3-deoxyphosphooctonate aldolase (KDO 8-P synthase)|nr:MAG: 2-dehydro-3-deoxyphosphooctonate aldolase [Syntrophorhabdaceae bacterium PtaU1.Bin034]
MPKEVRVGKVSVGSGRFAFIGGPCVIEGREITLRTAERLARITAELHIPFIFKSSYDKANRTSVESFRGPGLDEGLKILAEVRDSFHVPVLTDVHSPAEALVAAEVVDVLQVPALLSRQTDLLLACGRTGKVVNIKKGQFLSPHDIRHAIRKVESTGNSGIFVTERGTTFGYNNLVNDFRALPIMREFGYPVIFDATHSVQLPGGAGNASAGRREFVFPLARAAVAIGVEGVFMEVHEDPCKALCDGENSVPLAELPGMLEALMRIEEAL